MKIEAAKTASETLMVTDGDHARLGGRQAESPRLYLGIFTTQ